MLGADAAFSAPCVSESPSRKVVKKGRRVPILVSDVVAAAIKENGIEAAQYQVALKQVEALTAVGQGAGKQTIIVPAQALEAFGDAFKMLKGR